MKGNMLARLRAARGRAVRPVLLELLSEEGLNAGNP